MPLGEAQAAKELLGGAPAQMRVKGGAGQEGAHGPGLNGDPCGAGPEGPAVRGGCRGALRDRAVRSSPAPRPAQGPSWH